MLLINSINNVNNGVNNIPTQISKKNISCLGNSEKKYVAEGNEALKGNELEIAIDKFKLALKTNPNSSEARLGLAKAYKYKKDFDNAEGNFRIYLKQKPNDVESIVLLGEVFKEKGQYYQACEAFKKALRLNPNDDFARRNLLMCKNYIMFIYDAKSGYLEKRKQASENLHKAAQMAVNYMPQGYINDMDDVIIQFDTTSSLGGRENIAQYEHEKRKITVSSDYIYASSNLVGAYLVHEFVHAKDNDGFTSISEEQDAYRISAKYWIKNSKKIYDPEMDFVVSLYKKSPKTLDNRVEEIYKLRDPSISQTSPNHPEGTKIWAFSISTEKDTPDTLKYTPIIA